MNKDKISFKEQVKAFAIANKVRNLCKKFEKDFNSLLKDYDIEVKINMFDLCLREFKSSASKMLK